MSTSVREQSETIVTRVVLLPSMFIDEEVGWSLGTSRCLLIQCRVSLSAWWILLLKSLFSMWLQSLNFVDSDEVAAFDEPSLFFFTRDEAFSCCINFDESCDICRSYWNIETPEWNTEIIITVDSCNYSELYHWAYFHVMHGFWSSLHSSMQLSHLRKSGGPG